MGKEEKKNLFQFFVLVLRARRLSEKRLGTGDTPPPPAPPLLVTELVLQLCVVFIVLLSKIPIINKLTIRTERRRACRLHTGVI